MSSNLEQLFRIQLSSVESYQMDRDLFLTNQLNSVEPNS